MAKGQRRRSQSNDLLRQILEKLSQYTVDEVQRFCDRYKAKHRASAPTTKRRRPGTKA